MDDPAPSAGARALQAPCALVVDDNDLVRELVSQLLTDAGFTVDAVATAGAVLHLDVTGYDALVIDVRLGAECGIDLVETLRAHDPLLPRRCLLLTGGIIDSPPDDVAVLVKPFGADDLLAAVRSLLPPAPRDQPA